MKLKDLILKYGKDKINTLTKYPSILTLHSLDSNGILSDKLTTDIAGETMYATEKVDGFNFRIITLGDEFLLGSRKEILYYSGDLYWDNSLNAVNIFNELDIKPLKTDKLTITYGEFFGGKTSAKSRNYGKEKHGFRVFDVATINDLFILDKSIQEISNWRESRLNSGINEMLRYGQDFATVDELKLYNCYYDLVPYIDLFVIKNFSHENIYDILKLNIPKTNIALTDTAMMQPEGLILRNANRSKIVKVRYEDYEKYFRKKGKK